MEWVGRLLVGWEMAVFTTTRFTHFMLAAGISKPDCVRAKI
jgi:hypothetical protein